MHLYADARAALAATAVSSHFNLRRGDRRRRSLYFAVASRLDPSLTRRVSSTPQQDKAVESIREGKPTICTADELHYVPVPGTDWRLALWRYTPHTQAPKRNHPLMLLSGVATNAIGFDLSPSASFARHMASQGFDTWIVEVRGAGLSTQTKPTQIQNPTESQSNGTISAKSAGQSNGATSPITDGQSNDATSATSDCQSNGATSAKSDDQSNSATEALMPAWDEPKLVIKLTNTLTRFAETLTWYMNQSQLKSISNKFFDQVSKLLEDSQLNSRLNEISERVSGLVETGQGSSISDQVKDLSQKLVKLLEDGQKTVSPSIFDMQERFIASIEDFQKQLELILNYDWDFDHYLEEDIPAAMSYISLHSGTRDGKLLAIGHSMGGILLYAMVSKCCYEGVEPRLKAIVTLASSVDYTTSNSSLKLFLPLADPAQAFNVVGVPLGTLLQAAYNPLIYKAPYILSWLNNQISSQDMMHPELFSKLVLNNFCTVPAKVLLQLTSAFREGGLRNRTGTFYFKEHLKKCTVPVLALAGDEDLICPPEAVYETVKLLPENMANYKLFGKPGGPHYAHYDLVGGRLAANEVYPCIIEFLSSHDNVSS